MFDTTRCNINTKVVDVSAEACVLRKNIADTVEHLRPSSTAVHTDVLESMCICKKERHAKFEMPSAYGLDVHASRGNLGKKYFNCFSKTRSGGGIKVSTTHLE